ncbi:hypothetical protein KKJ22_21860, partial [Xenorhabdus bovienii]|uniref:hypothetical protein n=1 Tax=Xenorhabdus bovienii TaxID=40576 RepID=UPI0023B23A87
SDRSTGLARLRIGSTLGLILGPAFAALAGHLEFANPRTDMLIVAAVVSSLIPVIIAFTFKGKITEYHLSHKKRSPYKEVFKT